MSLLPRQPVPSLDVATLDGARFALGVPPPLTFDLLVFYRGLHCPVCARYLTELERFVPEFEQRGVHAIAISSDGEDRAREMAKKIGAQKLRFGYLRPAAGRRARLGPQHLLLARRIHRAGVSGKVSRGGTPRRAPYRLYERLCIGPTSFAARPTD